MCGIAGFLNPRNNDKKTEKEIYQILKKMNEVQSQCVKRKKEIPTQSS